MGWGSGAGKREVLDPAAGPPTSISAGYNPFDGRYVLIDVSGLAHKAAKKQPRPEARERCTNRT